MNKAILKMNLCITEVIIRKASLQNYVMQFFKHSSLILPQIYHTSKQVWIFPGILLLRFTLLVADGRSRLSVLRVTIEVRLSSMKLNKTLTRDSLPTKK